MAKRTISTEAIRRSTWLCIAIFAVFGLLLLRILLIQTVNFEKYQSKVLNQITTESPVPANRGKIYDRNGNVLATNITTYRVFVSPSGIKNAQEDLEEGSTVNYPRLVSSGMSEILDVSYDFVYEQVTEYTRYLDRTIKRKVDEETADKLREFIAEHKLHTMIYLEAQSTRHYPGDTLAAHMLGFTSSDGVGLYGLEYQYDKYLKGVDGYYVKARDSYGNEMPNDYASYIEAVDGYDLQTTIDTTVQSFLEEQLEQTVINHRVTNRACGIVMDVKSGAVLAMATSSPFDLNDPWKLDEWSQSMLAESGFATDSEEYANLQRTLLTEAWSNKAVTESYIPGSTFKIITSAMALEEQKENMPSTVTCRGALREETSGRLIHCHKVQGHGSLTFAEGLQQSCNVWFMTLGKLVGIDTYQQYTTAFGYKEKTGIDLPGEGNSIFASQMSQLDLVIYAFGQNFNVTPMQQLCAISSVANGGSLMTPYIVEKVTDRAGNVIYQHETTMKRNVVSEAVCEELAKILEEGVSGNGGAKNAYVAGYRVAAKTGTSEKKERECIKCGHTGVPQYEGEGESRTFVGYLCSVCGHKGSEDDFPVSEKYICSTVAFAPADDPEIAIIIIVDEPTKGVLYGSTVAAPYVAGALENILPYLGVEAHLTEAESAKRATYVKSYRGMTVAEATASLKALGLTVEIVGSKDPNATVVSQVPTAGNRVEAWNGNGRVVLHTGDEKAAKDVVVPDLKGMNVTAANAKLIGLGLNIRLRGSSSNMSDVGSLVSAQSVQAGTLVARGTIVTLTFGDTADDVPNE